MAELITLVDLALGNMRKGPKRLRPLLEFLAEQNDVAVSEDLLAGVLKSLASADPNDPIVERMARSIRQWDHEANPAWGENTEPHQPARRRRICHLLGFSDGDSAVVDVAIPPYVRAERSTVIATGYDSWYEAGRADRATYYWDAYVRQLRADGAGWTPKAVGILSDTTDDIVSRLADPSAQSIHAVKGLVVGYVQSGKTAHFTGVIAKAIDAGYRLVIVLAGTLNILRRQTQRRLDKDLAGKEQVNPDEYLGDREWDLFVSHGGNPRALGAFDIERLTGVDDDYTALGPRLAAMKFVSQDPSLPFNHRQNLRRAPARLVVIKKLPHVLKDLAEDLNSLKAQGTRLDEVPTLVIDDESDQASVNTVDPTKADKDERTATNGAIVSLLATLPRAQYVGYTATPFANVFVDPEDAEQLFPKDFIVSLPRPAGYLGVSDFFDFDAPDPDNGPNQARHVRFVQDDDGLPENLPKALDLFVLTGAVKLLREQADPNLRFKHHTMLVHHASQTAVHEQRRKEVAERFDKAGFTTPKGLIRLAECYRTDIVPHLDQSLPNAATFEDLRPFIAKACARITCDGKAVRIVNGDERNNDDTPDFDRGPVWAILVGGTKLSRGYTVEGLTISYYRRRASAGDTLMQMGRWFGFRRGYVDLVRWFVGTAEPIGRSGRTANLYLQFRALCRDEEAFREELTQYADDRSILPAQVPPLVHSHLASLKPTAKNKMYNAVLRSKSFSGRWTEKTSVAVDGSAANAELAADLLKHVVLRDVLLSCRKDGTAQSFRAKAGDAPSQAVTRFLKNFSWSGASRPFEYEINYAKDSETRTNIARWLLILPQVAGSTLEWPDAGIDSITAASREFDDETGFSVFSEPRHRTVAKYLTGLPEGLENPSDDLKEFSRPGTAALFIYLVCDKKLSKRKINFAELTVGFAIQFPPSTSVAPMTWSVRDPNRSDAVVVPSRR